MTTSPRTRAWRAGLALATGAAVLVAGAPAPSTAGAAATRERVAAPLQRDVDAVLATGATGVLAQVSGVPGPPAARAGVGDPAGRRPVPWDAKHRIESTTKTFVATVVLQLAGEGRVGLDDTVERWLPGLVAGNGHDGNRITVRMLLGHTSGLPDYADDLPLTQATTAAEFERERFRTYPSEDLVAMATRHEPVFAPGDKWGYANTNYVLAASSARC